MLAQPPPTDDGNALAVGIGRRARFLGALLCAGVCLGFYLSALAPGALGGDAGEMQVVPFTLTLVRYHQGPTQGRLMLSGAAFGLSLTHHRSMLVFGPLLILFWLWREPLLLRQPRRMAALLLATAAPLALYGYLPVGAARAWETALWKAPNDAQGWLDYILDRNFLSEIRPDVSIVGRLRNYGATLLAQFGWHGLALGLAGFAHQIGSRRDRFGVFLAAGFALQVTLSTSYQVPRNWLFFIPSFVLFSVWIGVGVAAVWMLAGRVGRAAPRAVIQSILAGILALASGPALWAAWIGMRHEQDSSTTMDLYRIDLKRGYQAERLIANGLARVAPGSLVLVDWEQATPFWYAQYATGQRRDVAVVYPIELLTPALTERQPTYIARTYPTLGPPYRFSAEGALLRVSTQPGFQRPQDAAPAQVRFGDNLEWIGYTPYLQHETHGRVYAFSAYFQAITDTRPNLQLSVRLWDGQGKQVWQEDRSAFALGMYPTSAWAKGEIVGDYFEIPLPSTLAPGNYRAGMIVYERRGDDFINQIVVDGSGTSGIIAFLPEFDVPSR